MQRITETLLERRGLAVWVEDRVLRLLKDGATVHLARGYVDHIYGQEIDYVSGMGDLLAADHYHEDYERAAYELGDLRMSMEEAA